MRVHPGCVCVQAGKQLEAADGLPDIHVPAIGGGAADEPFGLEQRRFERHVDDLRDPHLPPEQVLGDPDSPHPYPPPPPCLDETCPTLQPPLFVPAPAPPAAP